MDFTGRSDRGAAGPGPLGPVFDREPRESGGRTHPPDPFCSTSSCRSTSLPGGPFGVCGMLCTAVQIASRSPTAVFFMARTQQMLRLVPTSLRPLSAMFLPLNKIYHATPTQSQYIILHITCICKIISAINLQTLIAGYPDIADSMVSKSFEKFGIRLQNAE